MKATSERTAAQANWPLRAAAVLLCLVLASTYLLANLYARYTAADTSSDSARVASFQVTQTPVSESVDFSLGSMAPGSSKQFSVNVSNQSEVAIEYRMDVENATGNLPLTWSLTENGTATDAGRIPAGDTEEHAYTLTVTWPKNAASASNTVGAEGTSASSDTADAPSATSTSGTPNAAGATSSTQAADNQSADYMGKVDLLRLTLSAVQID